MAIPVDGSGSGPSSSSLTALDDAIRARDFSQLADVLDALELEVRFSITLRISRVLGILGL
jgi:hypothetical protein